ADGRARRWAIFTVARGAFSGQGPRVPHGAVCRALHWANVRVMLVARSRTTCREWRRPKR
ncbi:MAG: hypothetical protein ACXVII_34610, partial [Solirubrobacteraceae bacterium]